MSATYVLNCGPVAPQLSRTADAALAATPAPASTSDAVLDVKLAGNRGKHLQWQPFTVDKRVGGGHANLCCAVRCSTPPVGAYAM